MFTACVCSLRFVHAGKMELCSAAFFPAVLNALGNPRVVVLGSVPVARYGRTIPQVCVCCSAILMNIGYSNTPHVPARNSAHCAPTPCLSVHA